MRNLLLQVAHQRQGQGNWRYFFIANMQCLISLCAVSELTYRMTFRIW